jgi:5-methylcytosine-specific restriction protein A
MRTFLLTWNPDRPGWSAEDFEQAVEAASIGRHVSDRWSVAIRKSGIHVGDRGFLVRQHHERGIVASGSFTSEIYVDRHWDDPTRTSTYADIEWEIVLPLDDRLPVERLKRHLPQIGWDRLQGSGVVVPTPNDGALEQLWEQFAAMIPYRAPGELPPDSYEEGSVVRVEVNRYERDRATRAACITHYGTACTVCGFDFEVTYGELGRDFIHVHHLKEISTLGPRHGIDPIKDLRPLCPNCHAMAHRRTPAVPLTELRKALRKALAG